MFDSRLFHFIKKEFIQLLRDRRMVMTAIIPPLIQLIAFGYVASTDIKHVSTAVIDRDMTSYSRSYLQSFKNSGYFNLDHFPSNEKQMAGLIDSGHAKLGINIPPGFGKSIVRGDPAPVQAILDGSNSSSATIIQGYINQITFMDASTYLQKKMSRLGISARDLELLDVNTRIWYNPELKSIYFMVPAVFAQILMLVSMILTTVSIVKEKEKGTMEMLVATPLKPYELILGKLIPFALVAFVDIILIFLAASFWFGVVPKGSVLLLFALGAVFMLTGLGLGVFISTISRTQRQAMMTNVFIMAPSFVLSGFIFPIAGMPYAIQAITYFIPLRYFLVIVRDIYLKGNGLRYLWPQVLPLFVIGAGLLTLSIMRFRKKIE